MSPTRVVVDGSNVATEGRSAPSLRQLDDAVRQFQGEFPGAEIIVVVDATFGHRIDKSERRAFDEAVAHGELVSPPAGAIGRGDAFVLRIAERVNGQVLSNDSFQEFHDEHPWLFEEGRLIGGKPVPKVGWIFTPRRPVRPQPRRGRAAAVLDAVEVAAAEATEAATSAQGQRPPMAGVGPSGGPTPGHSRRRRRRVGDPAVKAAIEVATEEAIGGTRPGSGEERPAKKSAREGAGKAVGPQAVNDPLTFLTFISEHPLGDQVTGVVSAFVSHGAMVDVGPMHCYVPLSGLGVPPPNSAREVLRKGQARAFVLVVLDPPRRGAQLALPDLAAPAMGPADPAKGTAKPAKSSAKAAKASAKAAKAPAKAAKAPAKAAKAPAAKAPAKAAKAPAKPAKSPAKAPAKSPAKAPAPVKSGPTKSASGQGKGAKATKAATKQAKPAKAPHRQASRRSGGH